MKNLLKEAGKLLIEIHEDIKRKESMRDLTSFETSTKEKIQALIPKIREAGIQDQDLLS